MLALPPELPNEAGMPFKSRVGILLYQRNRERAEAGQPRWCLPSPAALRLRASLGPQWTPDRSATSLATSVLLLKFAAKRWG